MDNPCKDLPSPRARDAYVDRLNNLAAIGNWNEYRIVLDSYHDAIATEKLEVILKEAKSEPSQHEPGAKLDSGKNRLSLVLGGFASALQEVGEVGTFGANKYSDNGWKSVENAESRYSDALLRHLFSHLGGEVKDGESGLDHLAHAAWNILAVIELRNKKVREALYGEEKDIESQ